MTPPGLQEWTTLIVMMNVTLTMTLIMKMKRIQMRSAAQLRSAAQMKTLRVKTAEALKLKTSYTLHNEDMENIRMQSQTMKRMLLKKKMFLKNSLYIQKMMESLRCSMSHKGDQTENEFRETF